MDNNIEKSREDMLVSLMHEKNYRPMKLKELASLLQVPRERREELAAVLDKLTQEGRIGVSAHGKYGKPELFTVKGIFSSTSRGFGFVTVEGREQDIFIPPDCTGGALPQDTVLVAVTSFDGDHKSKADAAAKPGRRAEGRILRILAHQITSVVGTYQKNKGFGFVIPDNQKIQKDIFIEKGCDLEAANGDKVVAEIISYGTANTSPQGRITEVLGSLKTPGTDVLSIVRAYGLPEEFPEEVTAALETIPDHISREDLAKRRDIRDLHTVTIDGEDAKDLDDAITVSFADGIYHLGVHIADVSHYVKEGSVLDEEALKRGTSVYLVDRVIPMLPRKLSNGICSLNEGQERLALSCFMDIDSDGNVINHEIAETVIRVDRRMTYTMVASLLEGMEPPEIYRDFMDDFRLMAELSELLRSKRFGRGALDFDFPEAKILLDDKGRPTEIKAYERSVATRLIEDFMLLANETIAEEYFWLELPFVYRIHEKPDEDRMRAFATFINNFGFSMHLANSTVHPKELQKLLARIEGSSAEALISRILLRSLKQARYSPENLGHFGLSAKYYCHFTSPIRRYPDLQIHRIIKERLHGRLTERRIEHYDHILPQVSDSASKLERRADEAEREVEKLKKAQYMRHHIGEVYHGVISGVTAYGFYVELENTAEGLVRAANLDDDYYIYHEEAYSLVGEMTGRTFCIGQTADVVVNDVDLTTRTIEFLLYHGDDRRGESLKGPGRKYRGDKRHREGSRKEKGHGKGKPKADRK